MSTAAKPGSRLNTIALLRAANSYVQTQASVQTPGIKVDSQKKQKKKAAKKQRMTKGYALEVKRIAAPLEAYGGVSSSNDVFALTAAPEIQIVSGTKALPSVDSLRADTIVIPSANAPIQDKPAIQPEYTPPVVRIPAAPVQPEPAPQPRAPESSEKVSQKAEPEAAAPSNAIDFDLLAKNMGDFIAEAGKVAAAYMKPRENGQKPIFNADEAATIVKTLGRVAEHWLSDPQKTMDAQTRLTSAFWALWSSTMQKGQGGDAPAIKKPDTRDGRFKDPEWTANPYFDFLKQAYLITSGWAEDMVREADAVDPKTRHQAEFYLRQIASAISPSNFIGTNPELLRTTLKENGANLVRGMRMMAEDVEAGDGDLKVRQSKTEGFQVGVNMGTTPGKVVFRNELIELLQYTPTTPDALQVPLVIVPPWINKFYILDLNPEKSFIRWCVSQGLTVFVVSWVNPDERHAKADFETYMHEGVIAAMDVARAITGEPRVHTMGYCVGGTMLAVTLAWLAAQQRDVVASSTLLTTQVDFENAGDLKVFVDEAQIQNVEALMEKTGYLPGSKMASAFNMLRPQDLIWPYAINAYIKGQEPSAFDLLYWNSDSTRMPQANHSFYLRNCYLDNKLSRGQMVVGGTTLDLSKVMVPIYNLAAKEDHIAPALSVFVGSQYFGGPVRYVLGGSGHIAGVVNPADKPKYQYWTGGVATGRFEDWFAQAKETPGTWWLDWISWINGIDANKVAARHPGSAHFPALCDAPGTYVLIKA